MASLDTQFEVEKARNWKKEVDAEFEAVDVLLKRVAEECEEKPYEDDTLLNAFHEVGEKLTDTWTELGKQFEAVTEALENIAAKWEDVISKGVDAIQDYLKQIHI